MRYQERYNSFSNITMNVVVLVVCLTILTPWNQYCNIGTAIAQGALHLNYTNLMYHYFNACGFRYICDVTKLSFLPKDIPRDIGNDFYPMLVCPSCECDDDCFGKGNCCPDLYFSRVESHCKELPYITVGYDGNPVPYPPTIVDIVDECPLTATNSSDVRGCSNRGSKADELSNVPVTSKNQYQTFRNKYCAACNNVYDYVEWGINVTCTTPAELNFLSSYEEIVSVASVHGCVFRYSASSEDIHINHEKCSPIDNNITIVYDYCNQTGYWRHFDADIKEACESQYPVTHRFYKNIFCYMCNPPSHFKPNNDVIRECNTTSTPQAFSHIVQEHCHQFGKSFVMFPYKNVFCYMCNMRNDSNANKTYNDGTAQIFDYFRKDQNRSEIAFILMDIRLKGDMYKIPHNIEVDNVESFKEPFNITNLLRHEFAYTGDATYCNETYTEEEFIVPATECSCDPKCLFSSNSLRCCSDVTIKQSVTCQDNVLKDSDEIPSYHIKYALVDKCDSEDENITNIQRYMCENGTGMDIYSILPIDKNGVLFKNSFCAYCSKIKTSNEGYMEAFDIQGNCIEDVQYGPLTSIQQILDTAISSKCHIEVYRRRDTYARHFGNQYGSQISHGTLSEKYFVNLKSSQKFCNTKTIQGVYVCNATGGWKEYDHDVNVMCEKNTSPLLLEYRELICKICNPPLVITVKYSTCDPIKKDVVTRACLEYPETINDFSNIYRNSYCAICNGFNKIKPTVNPENKDKIRMTTFNRNIFSFSQIGKGNSATSTVYGEPLIGSFLSPEVFYDALNNIYRNVTCYPGRRLRNGICEPLLSVTTGLRYSLSVKLEGNITKLRMFGIKRALLSEVYKAIDTKQITILSENMVTDSDCIINKQTDESITIQVFYNIVFIINEHVNRQETEVRLLQIASRDFNFTEFGMFRSFIRNSINFKDNSVFMDQPSCSLSMSLETSFKELNQTTPHLAHVSKVLLCPQIILKSKEFLKYTIEDISIVFIISWAINISSENFLILDGGEARLCVGDLHELHGPEKPRSNQSNNTILFALAITNFICVSLSCVCLVLTLLTYSFLKKLRTLPGKNNMILVLTTLLAQIHLFVGSQISSGDHVVCKALGIASHYFVLCMFASMNICSYHMYKVFTSKIRISQGTTNTIIRYVIYVFILPAIIVVSNIGISWIILKDIPYGGKNNCMLTNMFSYCVSFYSPICIFCISNIGFFFLAFLTMRNHPKIESHARKNNRNELLIYLKLFSITGITWVLMIIDAQMPVNALSFVVMVLNAGQGMFIFLSFVCTKNVWNVFKETRSQSRGQRRSYSTSSTNM